MTRLDHFLYALTVLFLTYLNVSANRDFRRLVKMHERLLDMFEAMRDLPEDGEE